MQLQKSTIIFYDHDIIGIFCFVEEEVKEGSEVTKFHQRIYCEITSTVFLHLLSSVTLVP